MESKDTGDVAPMVFAAEPFWKPPNVYDVIGVVGLALALFSIWLSWWLATRDIKHRIAEAERRAGAAARHEIERIAAALAQMNFADVVRSLVLAREACNAKRWPRAADLCQLCAEQVARLGGTLSPDDEAARRLPVVAENLREFTRTFRSFPKSGRGDLPDELGRRLDETVEVLHRIEGRYRAIRPEV